MTTMRSLRCLVFVAFIALCLPALGKDILSEMDDVLVRAGSVQRFLDNPQLQDEYFKLAEKYFKGNFTAPIRVSIEGNAMDKNERARFDSLLKQVREATSKSPLLAERLYQPFQKPETFTINLNVKSRGVVLDSKKWMEDLDHFTRGLAAEAKPYTSLTSEERNERLNHQLKTFAERVEDFDNDWQKQYGLARKAKDQDKIQKLTSSRRAFETSLQSDPEFKSAAAYILSEKLSQEKVQDVLHSGNADLTLKVLDDMRAKKENFWAIEGIDSENIKQLQAQILASNNSEILNPEVPTKLEIVDGKPTRTKYFVTAAKRARSGNLVAIGRGKTDFMFRTPPRRFHAALRGLDLNECVGGACQVSLTPERWGTVGLNDYDALFVESGGGYHGFVETVAGKVDGKGALNIGFGSPDLTLQDITPNGDRRYLYQELLQHLKDSGYMQRRGAEEVAISSSKAINNAGVLTVLHSDDTFIFGKAIPRVSELPQFYIDDPLKNELISLGHRNGFAANYSGHLILDGTQKADLVILAPQGISRDELIRARLKDDPEFLIKRFNDFGFVSSGQRLVRNPSGFLSADYKLSDLAKWALQHDEHTKSWIIASVNKFTSWNGLSVSDYKNLRSAGFNPLDVSKIESIALQKGKMTSLSRWGVENDKNLRKITFSELIKYSSKIDYLDSKDYDLLAAHSFNFESIDSRGFVSRGSEEAHLTNLSKWSLEKGGSLKSHALKAIAQSGNLPYLTSEDIAKLAENGFDLKDVPTFHLTKLNKLSPLATEVLKNPKADREKTLRAFDDRGVQISLLRDDAHAATNLQTLIENGYDIKRLDQSVTTVIKNGELTPFAKWALTYSPETKDYVFEHIYKKPTQLLKLTDGAASALFANGFKVSKIEEGQIRSGLFTTSESAEIGQLTPLSKHALSTHSKSEQEFVISRLKKDSYEIAKLGLDDAKLIGEAGLRVTDIEEQRRMSTLLLGSAKKDKLSNFALDQISRYPESREQIMNAFYESHQFKSLNDKDLEILFKNGFHVERSKLAITILTDGYTTLSNAGKVALRSSPESREGALRVIHSTTYLKLDDQSKRIVQQYSEEHSATGNRTEASSAAQTPTSGEAKINTTKHESPPNERASELAQISGETSLASRQKILNNVIHKLAADGVCEP